MMALSTVHSMAAPPGNATSNAIGGHGGKTDGEFGRLRVLVVEDESVIAWALKSLLEDLGHDVVDTVFSGEGAVASAAALGPDLVVVDINLGPGISGIDAAERICLQQGATAIFVSAYDDKATATEIQARVPGAQLLSKPIEAHALEMAIAEVFHRHGDVDRLEEALTLMRAALGVIDETGVALDVGAHLDLAINRLEGTLAKARADQISTC